MCEKDTNAGNPTDLYISRGDDDSIIIVNPGKANLLLLTGFTQQLMAEERPLVIRYPDGRCKVLDLSEDYIDPNSCPAETAMTIARSMRNAAFIYSPAPETEQVD